MIGFCSQIAIDAMRTHGAAMPVHSFIHSLASIGVFPSRAFLPAFVAALLLRCGDSTPLIAQAGLAGTVHAPSWADAIRGTVVSVIE